MRSQSCWLIIQVPWLIVTTHSFIVSLTSISCFFPRCNYPARSGFSSWFHTYIIDNITYIYIYVSPPPGPTHVSISLTVSLQGQPSAICYLKKNNKHQKTTKKQCIGEPSPLPPSQSVSPKTFLFVLWWLFFLFLLGLFKINPSQI